MESQRQPHDRLAQPIAQQQRPGAGQARAAEIKERVPEAFHGLCSCRRPESSGSGARKTTSRRIVDAHRHHQNQDSIFLDEKGLDREQSRQPIACTWHSSRSFTPARRIASTKIKEASIITSSTHKTTVAHSHKF